ncbi:Histidine kinase osmosensor [Pleosporales sp. CAS-2024a]
MRIPIREQLGCLVLLASTIGLAVVAVATWLTNHNFVLSIRSTRLTLTASLKAAQLASNLSLMQILVVQAANRLSPQTALGRFYAGNYSNENWGRTADDYDAVFSGDSQTRIALQAGIYQANSTAYQIFNRTASTVANVVLPILKPDGTNATMGDPVYGFIPELYPKFDVQTIVVNSSFSEYRGSYRGRPIDNTSYLLSGPYHVNESFSLVSVTLPIINNTSNIETLGWLTTVLNAALITSVVKAMEGLDDTGLALLFGPNNVTNNFPRNYLYNHHGNRDAPKNAEVRFLVPPTNRSDVRRHGQYDTALNPPPFDWTRFPAIRKGFTQSTGIMGNAGSILDTRNEQGDHVAVGYALVNSALVDWMVVVEQAHSEVLGPIYHLRKVILACVFGTMGAMMFLAFPAAHFASRPIRRLRDATKRTVSPQSFDDESFSSQNDGAHDDSQEEFARKEGFFGSVIHYRRNQKLSRAEKKEAERRRQFRIPSKVKDRKHFIHDELTDLTKTFNEMTDELMMQYEKLEERVAQRTAELEQSKKAAEAANESKTLFIANISHELKTPLNGILGMCAVCMSEDDPVKLRRSLGIIYKSGDLLLNLLTDLLTFSKNQVGQQLSLDEKDFRLRDISQQILAIFDKQAKEGDINLTVQFEGMYEHNLDEQGRPNAKGDLAPFGLGRLKDMIVYGDQHRILQVVINLVSNSLKFTPPGGSVTLTIRCTGEAQRPDGRKASLQSRQSSTRNSKSRFQISSSEVGSVSVAPSHYDTANVINAMEKPSTWAHMMAHERSATPPPGRWLTFEFEVEDTGPGIPENLHAKIFEPFVQGDLGLSKKFGGTGLGLSICSQLAGLMKGTIGLKSEVGRGSVFTMEIPLKHLQSRADSTASSSNINLETHSPRRSIEDTRDALSARSIHSTASGPTTTAAPGGGPVAFDSDAQPRLVGLSQPFFASNTPLESPKSQAAAVQRIEAEATQRGQKVKVLVAEDNKTNQEVVLRMLKLEDVYDVTVAKDGQEALDKVRESMERQAPYNLVFMDVQMPNLDGLQSTRLIRQSGFSSPIVALTAYAEESNVKECLDSGMDFFLSKPIRRPALKHVLKTYCPPIPEEEESTTPPGSTTTKPKAANGNAAQPPGTGPLKTGTSAFNLAANDTRGSSALTPSTSPLS